MGLFIVRIQTRGRLLGEQVHVRLHLTPDTMMCLNIILAKRHQINRINSESWFSHHLIELEEVQ